MGERAPKEKNIPKKRFLKSHFTELIIKYNKIMSVEMVLKTYQIKFYKVNGIWKVLTLGILWGWDRCGELREVCQCFIAAAGGNLSVDFGSVQRSLLQGRMHLWSPREGILFWLKEIDVIMGVFIFSWLLQGMKVRSSSFLSCLAKVFFTFSVSWFFFLT